MSWTIGAAQEVIVFLCALVPAGERTVAFGTPRQRHYHAVTAEQGDEIARFIAARGGFDLFQALDERPGQFDPNYATGAWHWKLRQARNDPTNHFFDLLNGREVTT